MSQPITIAIDIRLLGKKRTGDEAVFFHLTRALLHRRDKDCRYLLLTDQNDPAYQAALWTRLECLGRTDIELITLPARNRFIWNGWVLPRFLARRKVDILHTQYILPFFLPTSLKVVTHIHDVSFVAHPEWIHWSDRFFLRLLIPRTMRRSDALVTPSIFTKNEILKYFPFVTSEKVFVVENAAGEEWGERSDESIIQDVQRKYGLENTEYFITIGTMQPRKNVATLIQAFGQARLRGISEKLVLVGNTMGHNVDQRIQMIAEDESLVFTGYVSDQELRALVAGARAMIFPSLYEGFGIPLLEAFTQRVPVIASDIPPFHEVAGKRALFFDPQNLAQMADTLYNFSVDTSFRDSLDTSLSGQEKAFSWAQSAEKTHALYHAISQKPEFY